MKLYVAGKFGDKEKIAAAIKKLEALGHTITHNWTLDHKFRGKNEEAQADASGVMKAEALVVFMDDINYPYRGSWTEIGIALGSGIPIYMVTTSEFQIGQKNVFFHHPSIKKMWTFPEVIGYIGTPKFEFDPKTHIELLKSHDIFASGGVFELKE